jgi:hypothetical protein
MTHYYLSMQTVIAMPKSIAGLAAPLKRRPGAAEAPPGAAERA